MPTKHTFRAVIEDAGNGGDQPGLTAVTDC